MNEPRFERWARALSDPASRRQTILASLLGGLALHRGGHEALARKKRKKRRKRKKKKKITRNAFGCVIVGGFCRNSGQCCSGICQGKKDRKTCQAHDQSTCQAGQQQDFCNGQTVLCRSALGSEGTCDTTTGNAAFCTTTGVCTDCTKDADCIALCGPQAACIRCVGCEEEFANTTTACVGPEPGSCGPVMA